MEPNREHVDAVCQPGMGAFTCSYLMIGSGGFCCAKDTVFEPILARRRAARDMHALSDNCSGPPDFTPAGGDDGQDPS